MFVVCDVYCTCDASIYNIHAFNMIQQPISKRAKPKPDPTNGSGDVSEVEPFTLLRGGVEC